MTDLQVIDFLVPDLDTLETGTHYRDLNGDTSLIVYRERKCPGCVGTTRIQTDAGVWATFFRIHIAEGHYQ